MQIEMKKTLRNILWIFNTSIVAIFSVSQGESVQT